MWLGYQNNKIKFYTEKELDKELYNLEKVEYTEDEYVLINDEYVLSTSEKVVEFKNKQRIVEIKQELNDIDIKSQRSTRAIICGEFTDYDKQYLLELESKAQELREELRGLQ